MPEIVVAAQGGRPVGSRPSRRLRSSGQVPGVVYGHGITAVPVAVDARALRAALSSSAGANALLALQIGDENHLTLAREVQHHPVRGNVTHVDFVVVRRDEVVSAEVPVVLVGEAEEVRRGEGVVEQLLFSLAVRALPGVIPDAIEVDVDDLVIGQTVRVGDLALPEGVEAEAEADQSVVVAQPPQVRDSDLVTEGGPEAAEPGPAGATDQAGREGAG